MIDAEQAKIMTIRYKDKDHEKHKEEVEREINKAIEDSSFKCVVYFDRKDDKIIEWLEDLGYACDTMIGYCGCRLEISWE